MNFPARRDYLARNQDAQSIFQKPNWVMLGIDQPDGGVRLVASDNLSYAELQAQFQHQDIFADSLLPVASVTTSLTLSMTVYMMGLIVIDAPDYRTAFEALFKKWSPERRRAIEG